MKIQTVLMDVDGTMTGYKKPRRKSVPPLYLLENLVMKQHDIERSEAAARILSCGDCNLHCLSEFLEQLQVSRQEYFELLSNTLKESIFITEDTKQFFRFLKKRGIALYSATTNSEFMTRAKLFAGGVAADANQCEWFTGYYSGCFFRDPEGKFSPEYYPSIMKHGTFNPDTTMMVGDEPERDMLPALRAGIRYGVTVDRTQKESLLQKDGGFYINSLDVLQSMIE